MEVLQCTASLLRSSGHWNSWTTVRHYLGASGTGTPTMHCLAALGQRALELGPYSTMLRAYNQTHRDSAKLLR